MPARPSAALIPSLAAGAVAGIRTLIGATALAALIFSDKLADGLPQGLGALLFSGAIIGIVVALTSSYPGTVAQPQDGAAAILAIMGSSLVATMPAETPWPRTLTTVLVGISATSMLTGAVLLGLGSLKLGTLVRFIPYPVIGGFLAGTGWLFVLGSFAVMTSRPMNLASAPSMMMPSATMRWAPGLVFAVALLLALRRSRHYLVVPGMLLGGTAVFYAVMLGLGHSVADARADGWLLGPFPEGSSWQPGILLRAGDADWRALAGEIPKMATVAVVSAIALLLNATGLELAIRRDVDPNRELAAAGVANIACGLGGGIVGFHALSATVLGHHMGVASRITGIVSGLVCAAGLVAGTQAISFLPRPLLGGLLLFMGLAFLIEWLYQTWFTLPRGDYLIIVLIVVTIGLAGYMQGVVVGILLAIVFFVVSLSRISVVRHAWSGEDYPSNVDRASALSAVLRAKGGGVHILELEGFIFFGTANGLLARVRERASDASLSALQFVVLDLRRVVGVDSSALSSFVKMRDLAVRQGCMLLLAGASSGLIRRFAQGGLAAGADSPLRFFDDLDHAAEWCEERILDAEAPGWSAAASGIRETLGAIMPAGADIDALLGFLERRMFDTGEYLMRQGDQAEDAYFIESGRVTVSLEVADDKSQRLRSYGPGALVGEIALYLGRTRTADVIADVPTTAHRVTAGMLRAMAATDPPLASAFHEAMVRVIAQRLSDADQVLDKALR